MNMGPLGFYCSDMGHAYTIANMDGGSQTLQFIQKEPNELGVLHTVLNGTTNETIISVLVHRLMYLNQKVPSLYNEEAMTHLRAARQALESRTRERQDANKEGTNKP